MVHADSVSGEDTCVGWELELDEFVSELLAVPNYRRKELGELEQLLVEPFRYSFDECAYLWAVAVSARQRQRVDCLIRS